MEVLTIYLEYDLLHIMNWNTVKWSIYYCTLHSGVWITAHGSINYCTVEYWLLHMGLWITEQCIVNNTKMSLCGRLKFICIIVESNFCLSSLKIASNCCTAFALAVVNDPSVYSEGLQQVWLEYVWISILWICILRKIINHKQQACKSWLALIVLCMV